MRAAAGPPSALAHQREMGGLDAGAADSHFNVLDIKWTSGLEKWT
jgi:hypothetical protein